MYRRFKLQIFSRTKLLPLFLTFFLLCCSLTQGSFEPFSDYDIIFEELPLDDEACDWLLDDDEMFQDSTDDWHEEKPFAALEEQQHAAQVAQEGATEKSAGCQNHLDIEPTAIVNGSVNVISGQYFDGETDFVIPGAEPFAFQRNYVSGGSDERGSFGKGWNRNYFGIVERFRENRDRNNRHRATVIEAGGSLYHYGGRERYTFRMLFDSYKDGVTNCGGGMMGARTNIRNNVLEYKEADKTCLFVKSSGEKMTYTPYQDRYSWRLSKELKPNGNSLRYSYLRGGMLGEVQAYNRSGSLLDKLTFHYGKSHGHDFVFIKCNGSQKAAYRFKNFQGRVSEKGAYVIEAVRESGPTIHYDYEDRSDHADFARVICKKKPEGRFCEIAYYHKGKNWVGNSCVDVKYQRSPLINRVMMQKAPVGSDDSPIITHRYFYSESDPDEEGWADVRDAYNHKKKYFWDEHQRLIKIHHCKGINNHTVEKRERFYWGDVNSADCTRLLARSCLDGNGKIQFVRSFKYDQFGNVLADEIFGNITGNNPMPPALMGNGEVLQNGCEKYGKYYTYCEEDFRLMKSMQEGHVTRTFHYKEGSNLLKSMFASCDGKIFKREFYSYDDNAVLIKAIEDDGASHDKDNLRGCSERRIRYIKLRKEYPFGLPEVIKEKYLDFATGKEQLIQKSVNHYSEQGRLIAQDLYDGNGDFRYTLSWEYDAKGNIIKESNGIGLVTCRKYDANGNKIFEQGQNPHVHKEFVYDYSDRLTRVDEVYDSGLRLSESYRYDYLSNKIASTDIYGNETSYEYDDFGRCVKTLLPAVVNASGELERHQDYAEYDAFDNQLLKADFLGNVTQSESTIYGKATRTLHPDGSEEKMLYSLNGTLRKHIHKNGSYTSYRYDHLERVTNERTFSPEGKQLKSLKYEYNTFHLLSETDSEGCSTTYRYDGAGRLIEICKAEKRTVYEYDAAGRRYKTVEYNGKNDLSVSVQLFDQLDRVVEERREDAHGNCLTKVGYAYDGNGNRSEVTTYTSLGAAKVVTRYDDRNQPIEIVDASGAKTTIAYRYDYHNEQGQTVPYSISTDALGNKTENIKDAQGRLVSVSQYSGEGELIHRKMIAYDANSNRCREEDISTKCAGKEGNRVVTLWTYDVMNRLTAVTEAAGCPEERHTRFIYDGSGNRVAIIKPDGVTLNYAYDPIGRMIRQSSSDGSIDYHYEYDDNDNLLSVDDRAQGVKSACLYDKANRLRLETLANGLQVAYQYDTQGRSKIITFPDGSGVEYVYRASRLHEVHRLSPAGKRSYAHRYLAYDLEDKVLLAKPIGGVGTVAYSYDCMGRPTLVEQGAWREEIKGYDSLGNLLAYEVAFGPRRVDRAFAYDPLCQLVAEKEHFDKRVKEKHTYQCDSLYNHLCKDGVPQTFNGLNQLLDDGKTRYQYDQNGNLIRQITRGSDGEEDCKKSFAYDALDRLIAVTSGNRRVCYGYDSQNRCLIREVKERTGRKRPWVLQSTLRFLYIGQNEVGSYDKEGNAVELRLLGVSKGAEIGGSVAIELKGLCFAPLHDHRGNIVALINAKDGKTIEFYGYSAYGREQIYDGEGNELDFSLLGNPWRFSSKRVDEETGLVNFGRRYYAPEMARWITPDPIGRQGGVNLYAYALNGPLTKGDLYGLFAFGDAANAIGNYISSFAYNACNFVRSCVSYAGQGIRMIGYHLVPVPIVRDVLQIGGGILAGGGFEDYHPAFMGKNISGDLQRPEPANQVCIAEVGGICTGRKDMVKRALDCSDRHEGCNVHYFSLSSDGLILDLLKAGIRRVGIPLPGDGEFASFARGLDAKVGGAANGGKVIIKAHSQGAILTENLKVQLGKDFCKGLTVYTFGAGKLLNNDDFYQAINYVSKHDLVPAATNPFAYTSAIITPRDDVIFLKSNYYPFLDHFMEGATYQGATEIVDKKIKKIIQGLQ